jgi:glycosyltransferase involved in cell wall biosynthesis
MTARTGGARVALFVPTLDGGGSELVMLRLARGLADRGHDVDLVLVRAAGERTGDVDPRVRIVDLRAGPPRAVTKTLALARYLRVARPRALVTADDVVGAGVWARALARAPTAVLLGVHTHLGRQIGARGGLGAGVRRMVVRRTYPRAARVVAVSDGVAENVAATVGLPRERIPVIPNPAVPPDLERLARERPGHPWLAPDGPPVVLGAGRLADQKDFPTLVRAFAHVHAARPDARLVILGTEQASEPGRRAALEQLAGELGLSDVVDLPGYVQNPYGWMAHAAVFALSSRYEGFGLVLAEAMATGVALVSTDCLSGPREILDDGRLGELVPVGDAEALGAAIVRALDDPGDREARIAAARRFTYRACVEGYEAILSELEGGRA